MPETLARPADSACPVLLISVGGSPEPVAYSLDHHRPRKVIFFASSASRAEIEGNVRPLTSHRWADHEVVTTPSHEDLTACLEALERDLPRALTNLGARIEDLTVDYTGGTKTMSAALVLGTVHKPVRYSYVGGKVRTKDGLGVVLDGAEAVVQSPNPWDVLASDLRRRTARQFNRGHFAEAAETAAEAASRVGECLQPFYKALGKLCRAYHHWQGLDVARVPPLFGPAVRELDIYARGAAEPMLLAFVAAARTDAERLQAVVEAQAAAGPRGRSPRPEALRALVVDLVVNAEVTARLAQRPDDGVARLYSALEKLAKAELLALGVDNSAATPDQVPESLREDYVRRYLDPKKGSLQFGLMASYDLLAALDHPVGGRFAARREELQAVLGVRNQSLLVHGWQPVRTDTYEKLLAVTLDFLGLDRAALPRLPVFPET
jgi:CRISPR-associated protein (TIGR02710 family)